jgi:hypothetical protein
VLSVLRANKLFKNLHKQVYRHYQVSNGKPLMTYRKQDSNLRPRVMSPTSQPLLYPASLVFACVNVKRRKLAAGGGFELPIVPFGVGLCSALMGLLSMEWWYFCPMLSSSNCSSQSVLLSVLLSLVVARWGMWVASEQQ